MSPDKNKFKSIHSLINDQSEILHALTTHTTRITKLQSKIRSEMGPPLSEHLIIANYSNKTLTIHTENPAWASKLRFNIPNILKISQSKCGLAELSTIRIKVIPSDSNKEKPDRKLKLSEQSKEMIRKTAETTKDNKLRSVLLRLSK